MTPIKVIVQTQSSVSAVAEVKMFQVARVESEGERNLKQALKVSRLHHTYSMAQVLGIYPA
jgi:hypothetical protein